MLQGLIIFSETSGLTTNAGKSNIFSVNMKKQCLDDICELTGYAKGTLPFKYLGVPISSKRLSTVDCEMLVDKMVSRIKTWGDKESVICRITTGEFSTATLTCVLVHYFPST